MIETNAMNQIEHTPPTRASESPAREWSDAACVAGERE